MKIIKKVSIIFLLLLFLTNIVAFGTTDVTLTPTYSKESFWVRDFGQQLFGLIRNIATISSVVLLAYCGMRITFGSLEQRAEYKKSLMPIIIGSVVVLLATNIVFLIQKIVK